jgi:glutathione S-transferase
VASCNRHEHSNDSHHHRFCSIARSRPGLARDTRVRWALEEVGRPYEVRLLSFAEMNEPAHLALHPFGQIPTYEEGDLALFETGSIILHIANHNAGLLPEDAHAQARAITWMFAAVNTVEPPILELATAILLESDKPPRQRPVSKFRRLVDVNYPDRRPR